MIAKKIEYFFSRVKYYGFIKSIKKILFLVDERLCYPFERLYYKSCMKRGKPYFGPLFASYQSVIKRYFYMSQLMENELNKKKQTNFKILEIGSWAGGSAITFAEAIEKFNENKGLIICIDLWKPYLDSKTETIGINIMDSTAKENKIFGLFNHNVKASGYEHLIISFRGNSNELLSMLKENQFDLIYIDGSHSYSFVLNDIKKSVELLKSGGILCGDDLELQFNEVDEVNLYNEKEREYSFDPKTKKHFHPGVCCAVYEFFKKEVTNYDGFWVMRKTADSWEKVFFKCDAIHLLPKHLQRYFL